ncbi:MAG: CHAT domain-containing protein [Acidobacteria bacterium]|nr:CHAT domain-containing protein [Acidobacteriota bacterium]
MLKKFAHHSWSLLHLRQPVKGYLRAYKHGAGENRINVGLSLPSGLMYTVLAMPPMYALPLVPVLIAFASLAQTPTPDQLAQQLVRAKSEADRTRLIEQSPQSLTPALVKALEAEIEKLQNTGRLKEAIQAVGFSLKLADRIQDAGGKAVLLGRRGSVAFDQADYALAEASYEGALALHQARNDAAGMARVLAGLSGCYFRRGDTQRALDYALRGIETGGKSADERSIRPALNNLGVLYESTGEFDKALAAHQRALDLGRRYKNPRWEADALNNMAAVHYQLADTDVALKLFEEALQLRRASGLTADIPSNLSNIAAVYSTRGDLLRAAEMLENSLTLSRKLGLNDDVAVILNNLGTIRDHLSDSKGAIRFFEESLTLATKQSRPAERIHPLVNLGMVYEKLGSARRALGYYQQALDLSRKLNDSATTASILLPLGALYETQGDLKQAEEYFREGLRIAEKLNSKFTIAQAEQDLGSLAERRSDFPQAARHYQRSVSLLEEISRFSTLAQGYSALGEVFGKLGKFAEADSTFEKAIAAAQKGGQRLYLGGVQVGLARLRLLERKPVESLAAARRAIEIAVQLDQPDLHSFSAMAAGEALRALGRGDEARQAFEEAIAKVELRREEVAGGEQQRQSYLEGHLDAYHHLIGLLLEQGRPDLAFSAAERTKARVLLDVLGQGRIPINKAMTPAELGSENKLRLELANWNKQIAAQNEKSKSDPARITQLRNKRDAARQDYSAFQMTLYTAHPELRVSRGQSARVTAAEAQRLLPDPSAAILEFAVMVTETVVFVITADGLFPHRIAVGKDALAKQVEQFRTQLAQRSLGAGETSRRLYDLVIQPVASRLEGKSTLLVVPDGALWELPLQALRTGQDRYMIEDHTISYAQSVSALREMVKPRIGREPGAGLLAMGNPALPANLAALPETEALVQKLGVLYGPARSRAYVRSQAEEQRWKQEAPRHRVLHLATHGVLDDASPMYSHVMLSRGASGKEDGLLEAWEVMESDLNADLVVLSACETARGRVGAGEGMTGLSWAFFVAGAPSVVASQWKVAELSTNEMMLEFHRSLQQGKSKAEALREAALRLMQNPRYRHPFYWAPFVLVGAS